MKPYSINMFVKRAATMPQVCSWYHSATLMVISHHSSRFGEIKSLVDLQAPNEIAGTNVKHVIGAFRIAWCKSFFVFPPPWISVDARQMKQQYIFFWNG